MAASGAYRTAAPQTQAGEHCAWLGRACVCARYLMRLKFRQAAHARPHRIVMRKRIPAHIHPRARARASASAAGRRRRRPSGAGSYDYLQLIQWVCCAPAIRYASGAQTRASERERPRRARKYNILCSIFGERASSRKLCPDHLRSAKGDDGVLGVFVCVHGTEARGTGA